MKKYWFLAVPAAIALTCFNVGTAVAETLPKSGTFSIHGGWKSIGELAKFSDSRMYWTGSFWGVMFNDKGGGPFHRGTAQCIGTIEMIDGGGRGAGYCMFADGDGDKAFMDYAGTPMPSGDFAGNNTLTGGTGKFSGIQGKGPFKCRPLNLSTGQWTCDEQFEYRLP